MIVRHNRGESPKLGVYRSTYYEDREDRDKVAGATINGGWMLLGALLGHWRKDDTLVTIAAWQPGFSAELSGTNIQVSADD